MLTIQTVQATPLASYAEVKAHLRLSHDVEQTIVERCIAVACSIIEERTGKATRALTYLALTDCVSDFEFPYYPVSSITTVKAWQSGALNTLSSGTYRLLNDSRSFEWITEPTNVDDRDDAIQITFVQAASIDTNAIKQATCMIAASLYENREDGVIQVYGTASYTWLDRVLSTISEVKYVC